MCGIAGVLTADRATLEPAVRRMMRAMVHRGPDDEGYEQLPLANDPSGPAAAFGFRRLAILDLSPAGHQPMFNPSTGDCLIFNGEIYNFRQLRANLQCEGVVFRSKSDTEVLLQALSQWGERALDNLDGMYAFAFYQARTRRILLARDPFGIKPLYVARLPRSFVFASEIRAVLASGLVPADLDPAGVAAYLAYGSPQDPLTVHKAVKSFPAGSCQWIDAGIIEGREPAPPRRYWWFPETVAPYPEQEAVSQLSADLEQSIRDQCASDVPLGVFLSGGIDSGTIAAFARKHLSNIQTFSVGFEGSSALDESSEAAATAEAIDASHHPLILDEKSAVTRWFKWLETIDRPSIDGLNTFIVSKAVKDQGATVALSGLGADELFGGYPQFETVPQFMRLLRPLQWVPSGVKNLVAQTVFSGPRQSRREKVLELLSLSPTPVEILLSIRRILSGPELELLGVRAGPLNLSRGFLPPEATQPIRQVNSDAFHEVSQAECLLYMSNTLLRDSDNSSMAHSLELRVPFLGRAIADRAASLPGRMHKPLHAPSKHLLRSVAKAVLPADVFHRPKGGFSLPIGDWMAGPLAHDCDDSIEVLAKSSVLDGSAVRRLWNDYRNRRHALHWTKPMTLVALGAYLRGFSTRISAE